MFMKKSITMKGYICAALTFIALSISNSSFGQCVTTASFGPSAVTESFEGYAIDANNPLYTPGNGYSIPGSVSAYTFTTSGISLTAPIPNNSGNAILCDYAKGSSNWGLINSSVSSSADVPSGNAFIGLNAVGGSATFTLPLNAGKVGVLVESAPGTITLTAYNSSNVVLGTCSVAGTGQVSNWASTFLGFNSALNDIAYITVSGDYVIIDQLTFEPCTFPVDLGGPYVQCEGTVTLDAGAGTSASNFTEGLDAGTNGVYTPAGWAQQNNSATIGTTAWFGGNTTVFPQHSGAGYIAANFNSTTGANDISNWLFTPTINLQNGDVLTFWTRTVDVPQFADRLQVRMSTNGASTNVGSGAAAVGDFTDLLLDINPTLVPGNYPNTWTQYTITISGLGSPTSGRLAFRYFVNNGGPSGANSDYIGLDDVQYSSAAAVRTFAWSNGGTSQTTTVSSSGTYTVIVTEGGCVGVGAASVTINTNPVVNLGGPYTSCVTGVTLDAVNAGSTYAWSDGTTTTQTFTANTTGTYSVTVTDANTCSSSSSASVTINLPPTNTTAYEVCQNASVPVGEGLIASGCADGLANVASFTGTTSLTDPVFNRSSTANSYTASGVGTAVHYNTHAFTVSTTGSYTFTLCGYDTYLHIYTAPFNPASPATNFLIANDDDAACPGGSEATITLTAGTNYEFVVTGFGNTDVGAYTVTFAGPGSVQQSVPATIVWFDVPANGSSIGSGSPFNPVGSVTLPNTNTPGTYTFYAACSFNTDCRTAVDFVVNSNPAVNLGGPYTQCAGTTVTLDAGNAGSTYAWSDGLTTTQTFGATSSNTYSVTVTDANTCSGSGSADVSFNPQPVVNLGGPYVQCGGLVSLNPGFFANGYVWDDASTNQTRVVSSTGTYSVTVTDGNNCTGTGSADVTIHSLPVVDLGGPYVQCQGTVLLDAGNAGSTYAWSDGTTTTQTLTATVTGDYSVTVTDANTCTGTSQASVTIYLPPVNNTGYTICQGLTVPAGEGLTASGCGDISVSFDGRTTLFDPTFNRGITGTTYTASGIGTAVHYATHTFAVGTTGAYTFNMCGDYDTYLHIYQNELNTTFPATDFLVADDDAGNGTCLSGFGSTTTVNLTAGVTYVFVATGFGNNDVGSYSVTFTGPGSVYEGPLNEVLWFNEASGGPLVATGTPFNPVGTATLPNTNTPGTYTFYSACPNTPDCRIPVTFVVNPSPTVNLGGPYNQCGGSVTLDAGAGQTTYSWSDGTSSQTTTATTSGTYTVVVTNSSNCSATEQPKFIYNRFRLLI
jgi:hypothetical protein